MNFIFKCSIQYLTSECSEQMRCQVEHEKIKFIFTSGHVISCLLYKPTIDNVFDDFLKISKDFPKFFQRKDELFRTFFGHFPKIIEDFRGGTEDVSIIQQHIQVHLRDYVTIAMVIILVTKAMPISLEVKDKNSIFTVCDADIMIF